jgi:putative membrane protein
MIERREDGLEWFAGCGCGVPVAGAIVGWLPGFSSGTANALLAIRRDGDFESTDARGYLVVTSAANTANAVLGIAALYAVGRMRSGAMVALGSLELPPLSLVVLVAAVAALCGYGLTVAASRSAPVFMRMNQRLLARVVLVFLVVVSFVFCGPFGLLILATATLVGMVPGLLAVPRIFCMGAIMVPVMLFTLDVIRF